ncbi:carotenoid oxygenase family protein [Streptomyces tendae]|uniref:carotenoid oxygenase family protein n=1 Tax=Streptomyces tendae TaxID=1932 RepID=UPI003646F7C8
MDAGHHDGRPDAVATDLEGHLTPVTEEVTAFDLPVSGRVPAELNGRYLRIGPNALGIEDPAAHHWMHGEGMIHGVRLRDGRAEWYRNRWVRSDAVRAKLGEPLRRVRPAHGTDFACNTHIIGHAGHVLALTEGGASPQDIGHELQTLGPSPLGGTAPGFTLAAHTKLDPRTGQLHSLGYLAVHASVRHTVLDPDGALVGVRDLPMPGSPMVHDFALTEAHLVLYDVPVTYQPEALGRGVTMPFAWDPRHPARVGVVPRGSGDVRWFEVTPCFVSHTLNAYEEDGLLVVDVVTLPDGFDIAAMRADGYGALDRWTIDLRAGTLHEQRLDDRPQEFPRVGESMVSRRHRYGYSAATAALYRRYVPFEGPPPDAAFDNALIKHDLLRGTSELHRFGRDAAVGEAVFVPAGAPPALPAAGGEDDGYLLAYVHSPERGAADLVILSAQDFTGAPLARVHLPRRIPLGLHGSWLPDS